jgi:hypothetical protein
MGPTGVLVPVRPARPDVPRPPTGLVLALDAGIGVAGEAARLVRWSSRAMVRAASPVLTVVLLPPVVGAGRWPLRRLHDYADRGRAERVAAQRAVTELVLALVPPVTAAVLDRVDLDAIVAGVDINRVVGSLDLDAIVAGVDINRVVASLDLDAIVAGIDVGKVIEGIDLETIAREVIDAIDLPEIVRESSGAMASDTVRGVRLRTVEADEQVNRIVDRLLGRRHPRQEPT